MSEPFGFSYLLDMYGCERPYEPHFLSNADLNYEFLEKLPTIIDMETFSPPIVIKEPATYVPKLDARGELIRVPTYPDKAGVSGVIFLITSSIVLHTIEPKGFATIDVYSCKEYDPRVVFNECKKFFGFKDFDEQFLTRGIRY